MDSTGYPWLVADVGGTNARFGLVRAPGAAVCDVVSVKCRDFASPELAALAYLGGLSNREQPQRAALALATAITGDSVKMTNSDWTVSTPAFTAALGARQVLLLNDFEALALALPQLADTDVEWMGCARGDRRLPMAVIGPGTGLGVAGCVPTGNGWVGLASEGGHVTAAAGDDFEGELLARLRVDHAHVSAERMLSGHGLPLLHQAACAVRGVAAPQLGAEEITRRALGARDADCLATIDVFCAMLGSFAGNVALTMGARGGVFVAGGIAQKLGAHFTASRFRERFEAKGRFQDYMARIATGLVTAPYAALTGAAQRLARLDSPDPT